VTDDPLAGVLAKKREALAAAWAVLERTPPRTLVPSLGIAAGVASTTMDAVEVALSFHERVNLYGNASTEGEPGNCPHHPDSDLHFEDGDGSGEWLCEGRAEGAVCSSCVDGEGGERVDWPCPEYSAILSALTGKAADDG
jgi:hypothetical protein